MMICYAHGALVIGTIINSKRRLAGRFFFCLHFHRAVFALLAAFTWASRCYRSAPSDAEFALLAVRLPN